MYNDDLKKKLSYLKENRLLNSTIILYIGPLMLDNYIGQKICITVVGLP